MDVTSWSSCSLSTILPYCAGHTFVCFTTAVSGRATATGSGVDVEIDGLSLPIRTPRATLSWIGGTNMVVTLPAGSDEIRLISSYICSTVMTVARGEHDECTVKY
jgi:hypothetical protein